LQFIGPDSFSNEQDAIMHRLTVGLMALALCTAGTAVPPHVSSVENGLLPPVSIEGEPAQAMKIRERMEHHKVPAISIAVIEKGRIAWARAYGAAKATPNSAATTRTLFQAGSLSKPVSAAGALTIVRAGKLSLDDPVDGYLTSWAVPASAEANGKPVTLRGLLSHTAGVTVHGFRGYSAGEKVPTLTQVLEGAPPANSKPIRVDQVPGTTLRYSGGGYVVAQKAIEDVTRGSFVTVMRDTILRPLKMADSTFAQPLPPVLAAKAAVGHTADGKQLIGRWHVFPEQAPAALWSTPTDLARFTVWLMDGLKPGAAPDHHFVAAAMMEPQKDASGKEFLTPNGNRAGLGLVLEGEGAALRFSHSGSNPGQKAFMIGFPHTRQGAVLMANSDASPALIQEVLRAIAAEYRWPTRFHSAVKVIDLAPAALQALAGTYSFESREQPGVMMPIVVGVGTGALLAELPDGSSHKLRPLSTTRFLDPATEMVLEFDGAGTLRVPAYRIIAGRK
jgi:CubicO group peptidase (beta-lactamase class C family)